MAVHVSHAALPYPIKNARYSLLLPYLDADGDPTAPTTPDTELSKDNAAAADCAEEVSATSGMDGMALLTLSGAETDCSTIALNAKVASGPKATLATLYPRVLASVGTGTLSAGSAGGGTLGTLLAYDVTGCFIKTTGGTGGGGTGGANNQARKIATYNTGTGAFTVVPNWETTPDNTTTYDVLLPEGVTLGMLRALNPTTAGRTLDVTSAGEAGLDFANVALPDGPIPALGIVEGGTAQSATATTLVGRAAATNDIVRPGYVLWAFGSDQGYWQPVMIDSVSGDTFTIAAWPVATPSGTITYRVWGTPRVSTSLPIPADLRQMGGDAQSATDLKDFADAGYDPATNKVEGVKLADAATVVNGLAANVITAAATAADFTTEIQSGLATAAALATVAGYLDTEIAAILQDTGTTLDGKIDAILALLDDARGEPGQGTPPVNPDLATKIDYLYKAWRNRSTQTASEYALYADDGTTKDHEAACSDDGTTFVRGEVATGA